jgi:hypothetical protein
MDRAVLPSEFREYYTDYVSEHAGSDRFATKAKE